ncbi:MAG: hypothetical protein G01um101449_116 [Parcubacteria group bacterium Gr01-1014_49]|nr:MAG: hypothetical protein G01um101449_116 [Parcubacteria group bacterium Gr01-1014_49]
MRQFRNYGISFLVLVAIGSFLSGVTGASHLRMNMQAGGRMPDCPLVGGGAICTMNPLEHIAAWQSAFAATFSGGSVIFLLLLISVFALLLWKRVFSTGKDVPLRPLRVRYRPRFFYPDPLHEAF